MEPVTEAIINTPPAIVYGDAQSEVESSAEEESLSQSETQNQVTPAQNNNGVYTGVHTGYIFNSSLVLTHIFNVDGSGTTGDSYIQDTWGHDHLDNTGIFSVEDGYLTDDMCPLNDCNEEYKVTISLIDYSKFERFGEDAPVGAGIRDELIENSQREDSVGSSSGYERYNGSTIIGDGTWYYEVTWLFNDNKDWCLDAKKLISDTVMLSVNITVSDRDESTESATKDKRKQCLIDVATEILQTIHK